MSSREHVLLEEVSGVHSTLDKCYYSVPSTNTISAEYASWLQPNCNIPIPANKCSFQNNHTLLNKSNLPLGQWSVRVFAGTISKQNMKYSLKSCTHFQISNPPFKGAVPLLEKSTFLHNICSIIDIEHRFQKCDTSSTRTRRGGSCLKDIYIYKTFLIYRTCMRRAPAKPVRACTLRKWCPVSHVTFEAPLRTSHFSLHSSHSSHSTLHTARFPLHTPHFTLHTPHFTLHSPHFTLHTPHFTLHTPDFTLHTPRFTLHSSCPTLHTPHFISSELFSPYPSSSLLISSLLICHLSFHESLPSTTTKELACAVRQPGPCVRALCEAVAVLLSKNMTCARPRYNANTFLTLHIALFTPHTPHVTLALHLNLSHLSSSHLIPCLPTCQLSSSWLFLCQVLPSTDVYYKSLQKPLPSTTLYYKACTKHFPVLLCTTKLAQSTPQYYFVLQSLHKHVPVLLCTTKLLHTSSSFPEKLLHTASFSSKEAFTHRSFYTQQASSQRSFHTQQAFTHSAFTHGKRLHTETFAQRRFYTQRGFYTQQAFTRKIFFTQQAFKHSKRLHTEHLHTVLLHMASVYTHRKIFKQRSFYTQQAFTQRSFTQQAFTHSKLLHREAFTHSKLHTQQAFTHRTLTHSAFTHGKRLHTQQAF